MPPILLAVAFEFGLVALAAALGRRLLRLFSIGPSDRAERAVVGTALGLGALQAVPFALYAAGIGHPSAFRLAVAVLALMLLPDLVGAARTARELAASVVGLPRWGRALAGVLVGTLALLFVRAQGPIVDGDALAYHLVAAQRWLDAGRFCVIPTIPYTNWPMSAEALASMLLALHRDAPLGILQFTFGVLTAWATALLARRIHGAVAGAAALVLLLAYSRFTSQFVTLHVELATAAYVTCAVLALVGLRRAAGEWRRGGCVAAAFAGLAATTKLSGLWAIPLAACVSYGIGDLPPTERAWRAARQLAIGAAIAAPWLIRCWVQTGNPMCPWLFSVFGGAGWTAEGARRFYYGHRLFCVVRELGTTLHALALQHLGMAVLGLAVAATVFWWTRHSSQAEPARMAAGCAAALAMGGYINSRFLMPALPCLAVCLVGWVRTRERRVAVWIVPAAVLCAVHSVARLLPPSLSSSWAYGIGRMDRDRWYAGSFAEYPVIRYANDRLPRSARILVASYEKRIALFRAEALWSDALLQDDIHYDLPARFEADLRRLGTTHLFLCRDYPPFCAGSLYCAYRYRAEVAMDEDLARRRGVLLYARGPARLYRLDWGAPRRNVACRSEALSPAGLLAPTRPAAIAPPRHPGERRAAVRRSLPIPPARRTASGPGSSRRS